MELSNGVLHHRPTRGMVDVELTRTALVALVGGDEAAEPPAGDRSALDQLLAVLDRFDFWFNIIEP